MNIEVKRERSNSRTVTTVTGTLMGSVIYAVTDFAGHSVPLALNSPARA